MHADITGGTQATHYPLMHLQFDSINYQLEEETSFLAFRKMYSSLI
jgi:hypothetical protein